MTLTVQSVRSVGFGMLIEQISFGANCMLIGPQENVSLIAEQMQLEVCKNPEYTMHAYYQHTLYDLYNNYTLI